MVYNLIFLLYLILTFLKENDKWDVPSVNSQQNLSENNNNENKANIALPCRFSHTAVTYYNNIYIFGGETFDKVLHDTILKIDLTKNTWSILETNGLAPSPRKSHTANVLNGEMYIFGGIGKNDELLNDMYKYSFSSNTWQKVSHYGHIPSPRYHHATTTHNFNIYLYGGFNGDKILSDFYMFNPNTNLWTLVHIKENSMKSPPKEGHFLTTSDNYIIMIGGTPSQTDNNLEIIRYDINQQHWSKPLLEVSNSESDRIESTQRSFFSACLVDFELPTVYIFGGLDATNANRLDKVEFTFSDPLCSDEALLEMNLLSTLPRSEWEAAALYYQPDVLAMCERIRPFSGESSYGKKSRPNVSKTQAMVTLNSQDILMMVLEWLALSGYTETLKRLQKDTNTNFIKRFHTKGSSLELLISLAKKKIKPGRDIWEEEILTQLHDDQIVESIDHLPDWHLARRIDDDLMKNIWDDDDWESTLIKDGVHVSFASVNTLIYLVLDYQGFFEEKVPQEVIDEFNTCFFYTFHMYTTANVLFEKLEQLFDVPEELDRNLVDISEHRMAVLEIIKQWIKTTPWDWTQDSLLRQLNLFIDSQLSATDQAFMGREIKDVLHNSGLGNSILNSTGNIPRQNRGKSQSVSVVKMLSMDLLPGNNKSRKLDFNTEPIVPKNIFSSKLTLDDVAEIEIARQLTIMHFSLFSQIKPCELLNEWWKSDEIDYRCPNLQILFKRSEKISLWVQWCILRMKDKKSRLKQYERLIKIADHLKHLNNFDALCAVIKGLQSRSIEKLKLYDACTGANKKVLDTYIQIAENADFYQKIFTQTDTIQGCIPCMYHLLNSIGRLEKEEDKTSVPVSKDGTKLINFNKCRKLCEEMKVILKYQSIKYNLLPVYQIAKLLKFESLINEKEVEELEKELGEKK